MNEDLFATERVRIVLRFVVAVEIYQAWNENEQFHVSVSTFAGRGPWLYEDDARRFLREFDAWCDRQDVERAARYCQVPAAQAQGVEARA